ncbi:winged helix-turn-helix domain-containing protein [Streptomyces sp. NPDC049585]|uniref:ArsR/SmtB family transcription factor n=1 Tax=Streptomyces sp. NPDC049585 TaxID=3155154 RepID=UPI0034195FDF
MVFSAGDLAQMRFAVSPMWEVGPSFRLLASGGAHAVHGAWAGRVRPRLVAAGLERGWLAELVPPSGYVPDFLNPTPHRPAPDLAEELAGIAAARAEDVRGDLERLRREQGGLGPRARALYARPRERLAEVAEEIGRYWQVALAPYWARIRAVLDADVTHRARQAAGQGAARVLNDLHASVRWDEDTLRVPRRPAELSRRAGRGLLLIPSVFTGPGPFTRIIPVDPPQLAYPARGFGSLWEPRSAAAPGALTAVLGRSRAMLLAELDGPASTTELAGRTGLSPAGVSQNLTALRGAGLVSAHRVGRSVLYARTSVADCLLAAARP